MAAAARTTISTLRLSLLILEGHGYLLGTILIFAAILVFFLWGLIDRHPIIGLLAIFVGLPVAALTGAANRALLFRTPEPGGVTLSSRDAPALATLVEEVRRALGSPRIHRLVIGTELNASASQIPRLVTFWPRNTLVIGYPLLLVLSPGEFRAVVAHELAHLFHAHGTIAGWAYRTYRSWVRLVGVLNQRGTVPIFVRWILASYVPRLMAGVSEISRGQEAVADRCAASIAGSRNAADALVSIALGQEFLDEVFWPKLFEHSSPEQDPLKPYSRMRKAIQNIPEEHASADLLARLLYREVSRYDTHPSLNDRLRAIGEDARIPQKPEPSAGHEYLGTFLDVVSERLDMEWQAMHGAEWRERCTKLKAVLDRLAQLEARTSLSSEEAFERGALLEELGREKEALAAYLAALQVDDGHGPASLAAGRILLSWNDPKGVSLVERSIELDRSLIPVACEMLARHYQEWNRPMEAERCQAQAKRYATQSAIAKTERIV